MYCEQQPGHAARGWCIKLFLNIHKPGAPRDGGASDDYLTLGRAHRRVHGERPAAPWRDNPRYFTWQPVTLPRRSLPHDSVRLVVRLALRDLA